MKHIVALFLLFSTYGALASDLTIGPSITSPVSGCNLTSSETVKITIINADIVAYSGTFDVSYTIGATTVTESITVPLLPTSTTYIYEFSTDADLSACGVYDIQFVVSDAGDTNPNNDTLNVQVTNDCTADPGTFSGPGSVCVLGNSGTIDLIGNNGVINDWEISTDGGNSWNSLSNTTSSQSYLDLTMNTDYRVIYSTLYNYCPDDTIYYSITVDQASIGGTVTSDSIHCDTIFPTVLYLNGYSGQVLNWQVSLNGGATYSDWVNPYDTLLYTELSQNFQFFAIVENGSCPQDSSNVVNISYIPGSSAGDILGPDTLCTGETSAQYELSGDNGNILSWSTSIDNGTNWTNLPGPSSPMEINNITQNTLFQVIVQEGACPMDTTFFSVDVIPNSDAGNVIGEMDFCDTINMGTISTSGFNGDILGWISTTDGGDNFTNIPVINDSITYNNLNTSTSYAVITQYLNCPADTSGLIDINVFDNSNAGTITAIDSACPTSDIIWLVAQNYTGDILDWEFSIDDGQLWQSGFNTSDSFAQIGLNQSVLYRIIVQEGTCDPDTAYHSIDILPSQSTVQQTDTLYFGESIQLTALDGVSYLWHPDEYISDITIQNPVFSPVSDLTYSVEITNEYGCSDTSFYHIIVVDNPFGVTPSNLVTPNGDGKNENWIIENIELYTSNSVVVFDAYGQIIHKSSPYLNDWNLNTSNVPDGTYYYVIELNSSIPVIKGTFTVMDSK